MYTYHRQLKNGIIQEFVFKLDRNKYILVNIPEIIFDFTVDKRFVHFNLDTHNKEDQGYGTALLSILFEFATYNHFDFICGYLSLSDYENGNWKRSIPFYLHKRPDAYLIQESIRMRNVYPNFKQFDDFNNHYTHFGDYTSFTADIKDGYIIYPLTNLD